MKDATTKKRSVKWLGLFLILSTVCLMTQSAQSTLTLGRTGTSANEADVEFEAQLATLGDMQTIELLDNSLGSLNSDDDLSGCYFDIASDGVLVYRPASCEAYRVEGMSQSLVYEYADLEAALMFDNMWQYLEFGAEIQARHLLIVLADSASKPPATAE